MLLERITEAAQQGFAAVINQTVVGDISVAAAITDDRGDPVRAINVSVPTTRWTLGKAVEQLAAHVQLAATSISQFRGSHS